ncbi:hypothetical protein KWI_0103945 [Xanthomonas vasicola pv. vasculorum NCPPB 206]|nr:hypothetical protein KWI_0103945 [Xanthomonas vasicola pv. vasculorum NCPPB 206]
MGRGHWFHLVVVVEHDSLSLMGAFGAFAALRGMQMLLLVASSQLTQQTAGIFLFELWSIMSPQSKPHFALMVELLLGGRLWDCLYCSWS